MKFQEAVETCLKKYADFEGEATRSEYWWFALFIFIVGIRRLHDTNRSGWWLLVGLVPFVGWLILLIFMTQPGRTAPTPT